MGADSYKNTTNGLQSTDADLLRHLAQKQPLCFSNDSNRDDVTYPNRYSSCYSALSFTPVTHPQVLQSIFTTCQKCYSPQHVQHVSTQHLVIETVFQDTASCPGALSKNNDLQVIPFSLGMSKVKKSYAMKFAG